MASITTTLSVKDQASPAIKKLQEQIATYSKGHASAIAQVDKQNKN